MKKVSLLFLLGFWVSILSSLGAERPNFVIIFTDDQGYNDLSCFGSKMIQTPHLDQMAKEGRRYTSFMSASPVCTPSRAALLTGCYPKRINMAKGVLFPFSTTGLHPDEVTIADHLKANGYATACVGKWHLGHHKEILPTAQGFDSYYGIPYSNDMNHPDNKGKPKMGADGMDILWADPKSTLSKWKTPLYQDEEIIENPVDQRTITRRYTDKAIEFLKTSEKEAAPFFLYLAHSMPHIPLYVPDQRYNKDPKQAYKITIEHIDEQVGRILDHLRKTGLDQNTYVIFTTDNGPWLVYEHHGGSAFPLRAGKGTTFEGGQRVPCIMWAPGRIPAGTKYADLTGTIDLLPTIASLSGTKLSPNQKIDGLDISVTLTSDASSPRQEFLYYSTKGNLEAIRQGDFKLFQKKIPQKKRQPVRHQTFLFNLKEDVSEKKNLKDKHPELVKKLTERMNELNAAIIKEARPHWKQAE